MAGSIPSEFTRDWALRWVRGSVESYIAGRTRIEVVEGRIRRAVKSYGVSPEEVGAIVSLVTLDPALRVPKEVRKERAKPLLEYIENLSKGGSSG